MCSDGGDFFGFDTPAPEGDLAVEERVLAGEERGAIVQVVG